MKKCSKCSKRENRDIFKPYSDFSKDKSKKDGYCSSCKTCSSKKFSEWYSTKDNSVKCRQNCNKYYYDNKEEIDKKNKEKYSSNRNCPDFKEKRKIANSKYRISNKIKINDSNKKYRDDNKQLIYERIKLKKPEYDKTYRTKHKNRLKVEKRKYFQLRKSDPKFRLKRNIRSRLKSVLKQKTNLGTHKRLISCTPFIFFKWVEFQFDVYMSWENYGVYWVIDHVKPVAAFNLEKETERSDCMHWKNLRPFEKIANIKKGSKYTFKLEHLHNIMIKSFEFKIRNENFNKEI